MDYFENIYKKRLNRYGDGYQSRIQGQRERFFEELLQTSIYRVNFEYENQTHRAVFRPDKQNETKILHYLLTDIDLEIPNGTILMLPESNKCGNLVPWMVYYQEQIFASGYNRYTMLMMTHEIHWTSREGEELSTPAYFYGQEDNMLKDALKSRSRSGIVYNENLKLSFFVTPTNAKIKKDDYFETTITANNGTITEAYVVTGYDYISTPGVEFVSVDPVYLRDHTPAPEAQPNEEDSFWLGG